MLEIEHMLVEIKANTLNCCNYHSDPQIPYILKLLGLQRTNSEEDRGERREGEEKKRKGRGEKRERLL